MLHTDSKIAVLGLLSQGTRELAAGVYRKLRGEKSQRILWLHHRAASASVEQLQRTAAKRGRGNKGETDWQSVWHDESTSTHDTD